MRTSQIGLCCTALTLLLPTLSAQAGTGEDVTTSQVGNVAVAYAASFVPGRDWSGGVTVDVAAVRDLAKRDPMTLLEVCLQHCQRNIRDYSCRFTKLERVNGDLRDESTNRVLYRDSPYSVYMVPEGKADSVRRVLYVEGRWRDRQGREMMVVEPAGWKRLLAAEAKIPIHDQRVFEKNRNAIDEFGFRKTLTRLLRVSHQAQTEGVLDLRFEGVGEIAGRPTLVLVRHLPYDGPNGKYPDARVVVHLDQQWLVPMSIKCYADVTEKTLIASYVVSDLRLNPGLGEDAFQF